MNARAVLDACSRGFVLLGRVGEDIELESVFPEIHPLTPDLVDAVRRHKPELLHRLKWQEEADALVIGSTRRMASAWPGDCTPQGPEWELLEQDIDCAYSGEDMDRLASALEAREAFARALATGPRAGG